MPSLALWVIGIGALLFPDLCSRAVETARPGEPIQIVCHDPHSNTFVEQIGGSHVQVMSLLSGLESEHTYSPRPSDIIAVRKARLLVEIGVGLEVWVAALVKNAGSTASRVITTSKGIALIRDQSRRRRSSKYRRIVRMTEIPTSG